jgi:peptidoglycan/xylan/chitin deacetylase (PgdA/CDA1 family)
MKEGILKNYLRLLAAWCFYYSGLVKVALWWRQRASRQLIILNYHRATGGDLRSHLCYLRQHYRLLPLEQALEELYQPSVPSQRRDWRMPLVITFDDGYQDNYTHAFALARELEVPITLFLIPGYIESGDHFWWLEGQGLVQQAKVGQVELEGRSYRLALAAERADLARQIDARVRYARSVAEREAFLAEVRQALGVAEQRGQEERAALPVTWAQVREMAASGWVTIGAHTMHHPLLGYLVDPAEVRREVAQCRGVLEQQTGQPVRTFAYPVGRLEVIGDEAVKAVKDAPYQWAVTTIPKRNTPQTDPYLLYRLSGDVTTHWLVMASHLVGLLGILTRLREMYHKRFSSKQAPTWAGTKEQSLLRDTSL